MISDSMLGLTLLLPAKTNFDYVYIMLSVLRNSSYT